MSDRKQYCVTSVVKMPFRICTFDATHVFWLILFHEYPVKFKLHFQIKFIY